MQSNRGRGRKRTASKNANRFVCVMQHISTNKIARGGDGLYALVRPKLHRLAVFNADWR
jgi:hypothetical protein